MNREGREEFSREETNREETNGDAKTRIENQRFGMERALFGSSDLSLFDCRFEGEEDGESALKHCQNVEARRCQFFLRYPFWHTSDILLEDCRMHPTCRAALWYCKNIRIQDCVFKGIKVLRECSSIKIFNSEIVSEEMGWFCKEVEVQDSRIDSQYAFLKGEKLVFKNMHFSGKYAFQYTKDLWFENCVLDTKDAFWHSDHVICNHCVIRGEYLGWYSNNLRLNNCKIIGTQPLCECTHLSMHNCTMESCDLAFENSDVEASVSGHIDSVKNPRAGRIEAESIGTVIIDDAQSECLIVKKKKHA